MIDENLQDAEFRRAVALRALYLLGDAMDANGGRYSGGLVPNITSIAHILTTCTASELRRVVDEYPRLNPATQYP